ncbi:hypothetical protein HPCPY1124_0935 [Helicobacter pylori CPY1124]|nr:hypothetical protein HPCPY1124_0935 [Helicobacter pylori CPY1124]
MKNIRKAYKQPPPERLEKRLGIKNARIFSIRCSLLFNPSHYNQKS